MNDPTRPEPGQLIRLDRFRLAHPEVVIGDGAFRTWQARIPEPGGEVVITRRTLRQLLDKLASGEVALGPAATSAGPSPEDGPWHTRQQAAAAYAWFVQAAVAGVSGAPGHQLHHAPGQLQRETITDTLDVVGVELGDYDRRVIAKLAGLLDPVECAVVDSLLKRAARDDYAVSPDQQLPGAGQ